MAKLYDNVKNGIFPIPNLIGMSSLQETKEEPDRKAMINKGLKPYLTHPFEYLAYVTCLITRFICAFLIYKYHFPIDQAKEYNLNWILPIFLRNIVIFWFSALVWDWLLYFSPFSKKMQQHKFKRDVPPTSQFIHDAFWSFTSVIWTTLIESYLLHGWATGAIAGVYFDLWEHTYYSLLILLTMSYWRIVHFHIIHRGMHKWNNSGEQWEYFPDVGAILYKYVHSLHHKSYNPTALSGVSMHPVESIGYLTAALMPLVYIHHPIMYYACTACLIWDAQFGHDGMEFPGYGSHFHYLHHAHFEGNYGDPCIPLDWLCGTFITGDRKIDNKKHR